MSKVAEVTQNHFLDSILIFTGVLSPWWLNFIEPGLRAFVLICTAIVLGWRVFKMFVELLQFLGIKKKTLIFEKDEED